MTAKIKLNSASGGGSFSLQAPSSSSNDRVMTLPDTADGTLLTTTNPKSGNILQVQSVTINSPVSAAAAGTTVYADIAGMSITITPAASANKILISCHLSFSNDTTARNDFIKFVKDGSDISAALGTQGASGKNGIAYCRISAPNEVKCVSMTHLDTAGGTSAITYKLQWSGEASGTRYLNRRGDSINHGAVSSFTVMEVAA